MMATSSGNILMKYSLLTLGDGITVWVLIIGSGYISRIRSTINDPKPEPVPPPIE